MAVLVAHASPSWRSLASVTDGMSLGGASEEPRPSVDAAYEAAEGLGTLPWGAVKRAGVCW